MAKQEKLHAVEKAIRKSLPRLLRDSVGCKYKDNNIEFTLIGFDDVAEVHLFQFKDENGKARIKYVNRHYFDTIGHDILLTDVLKWLEKLKENGAFEYNEIDIHKSLLTFYAIWEIADTDHPDYGKMKDVMRWDLSNPYLKDQHEELINFLYDLIKE